jgi:hypothetical protein
MMTVGTLESLHETLKQTIEEKKRIDAKIADIKKTISDYTAQLQSLGNTVQAIQPDTMSDHLQRSQADYQHLYTPTTPVMTERDVKAFVAQEMAIRQTPPQKDTIDINVAQVLKFMAVAGIMLLVIWLIMAVLKEPKASGCTFFDRIQSRVQERREYIGEDRKSILEGRGTRDNPGNTSVSPTPIDQVEKWEYSEDVITKQPAHVSDGGERMDDEDVVNEGKTRRRGVPLLRYLFRRGIR